MTAAALSLPGNLEKNRRFDRWLRFSADGRLQVFSGKVELGQGILTALAQIVAEELDLPFENIDMIAANTAASPNEAVTSGSLSIQDSGAALRQACAQVRTLYLAAAAARLGVAADELRIDSGRISCPDGRHTSYRDLAGDPALEHLLEREAGVPVTEKATADYRVVGTAAARLDLPDKAFGVPRFIHDLELSGMLHGRMLRPPSASARLVALDESPVLALPGIVTVVRDGSLLGVIAERGAQAERALSELARLAVWDQASDLPDESSLTHWLKSQPADTSVVAAKGSTDAANVARTLKAAYAKPYLAHASIAPSCALARFDGDRLSVWSHSQGIYNLRRDLALSLAISEQDIVVQHVEGAGCYGHNGADDVAFDAARLSRAVPGRPVRVQWSRADELSWAPFGPAMAVELEADLNAANELIGWRHTVWSNGHGTRPGRSSSPALLGAWHLAQPFERPAAVNAPFAAGGGAERNAVPPYDFPAWHVVNHRVLAMPLRVSALRALGAFINVFACESFIDELAQATGTDPVEFRLRHLMDPRGRAVIERALERSAWRGWAAGEGRGHGIGYARYKGSGAYCAVVAEVEAEAEIRVRRLFIAVDVGIAINPDGVANQIEGGAIQAASWALKEAVRFDRERVTSDAWEHYPILRFSEIPAVEVDILRSGQPPVGAGEASLGPTAAAIANAVHDALGVRVRELPITAERILSAGD
ncbi:nicotinate dehydrogenase subunit B [mine drainage metagenome]|uniref:Nicotinate dehydrogenase subunit B n=1 Tax=mine drainage metagenome TaxID=410659 RepID=A0A1J5RK65_9ZZZZ